MAFLVVGGVTVPVAPDGAQEEVVEIGDRARAFDGDMRGTVRSRKAVWRITTTPQTTTASDTLKTALITTTLPVTCSGDFIGGTENCVPEYLGRRAVKVGAGHRMVTEFLLHEA